jgi:DNA-binding response OmpR family regulator
LLIKSIFEEEADINVVLENNSELVISEIRKNPYDLILLDLMMPVVDGFDILKTIQDDPSLVKIPVIVLSAKKDKQSIIKAFEYGAVDYVCKPLDLTILKETVISRLTFKMT